MADRQIKPRIIPHEFFNLGGIADSIYEGIKYSVADMVGFDIHSVPGLLQVNQKFKKISASTIDDLILKLLMCSDGFIYAGGSTNGKVWKIDPVNETVTLLVTVAPAAGSVGIQDMEEYDGYIYYAMGARLGRVAVGAPTDWTTRNDSFQTFTNADALHPMLIQNQVLYMGDGKYVSQYDSSGAGAFTAAGLTLKAPLRVSALGKINTDLLIGTTINNGPNKTQVFRWNTWSVSYSASDFIDEVGINAFIPSHDQIVVNAGLNGNLYILSNDLMVLAKQIPGTYSPTLQAQVRRNAVANFLGLPLFGVSNITGNPIHNGIWSYGSKNVNFPKVLNCEVPISTGDLTGVDVGAMCVVNNDVFTAWKATVGGTTYGIDKKDYSNKYASAFLDTRLIRSTRVMLDNFMRYQVDYASLPSGSDIQIWYSANNGAFTQFPTANVLTDAIRNAKIAEYKLESKNLQIRVKPTVSVNNAPTIESLIVEIK